MNNDELIEKVKSKVKNNKYIAENDVQFVFCKNLIFNYSDKYEIIDALKDVDLPIITVDTSSITLPGYVGKSLSDELTFLLKKTNGDLELAQRGIVILDEFNRIAINDRNIYVDKNKSNYDQEISLFFKLDVFVYFNRYLLLVLMEKLFLYYIMVKNIILIHHIYLLFVLVTIKI